jgi:hypothetical protein
MTAIVVSRRDGVLRAPDGTKYRVARGKTLAEADHPAVLANPGDWVPMVITLTVAGRPDLPAGDELTPSGALQPEVVERLSRMEDELAELEETLAQRDAELTRLADGYASLGHTLPVEEDREPGWLVDLVLHDLTVSHPTALAAIAPPKPRKRAAPPAIPPGGAR